MRTTNSILAALLFSTGCGDAADSNEQQPADHEKEIALALSAAPAALAEKAGVYVLEAAGYVEARGSQNGFVCIVDHRIPIAVEPQCFDAEGVKTFLPRLLKVAALRAQGTPEPEIRAAVRAAFDSGKLRAPERPGIVYMLSPSNFVTVDEENGIAAPFPPHLMFYAAPLKNADIGSDGSPDAHVFIVDEGSPHALMIVPAAVGEAGQPEDPGPAPSDETMLAESAAPPAVAEKAGLYLLDDTGYVKARESQNGFVCIVDHRIPISVEPQCFDAEGVKTFLPRLLKVAELRAQGMPEPDMRAAIRAAFDSGEFRAPERPGIVYMLSPHNFVTVDEENGIAAPFPPHLMFYAPFLTNADIGSDGSPSSPVFIVDEKSPHALMIVPIPGSGMAHSHASP